MSEALTTAAESMAGEIPVPIAFTESAARKVWELIEEEGNPALKLRVYITGGGCSGFQYGFTFDEVVNADDTIIAKQIPPAAAGAQAVAGTPEVAEDDGEAGEGGGTVVVQLLVDPTSFQYLAGAEIDYKVGLEGEQFIIRNPNAKTTCGCGSSFAA